MITLDRNLEIMQKHMVKITIKQYKTKRNNLDRLVSQFKDQVKHDLVPFNILTATSVFLALPCRLTAVALAT